MPCALRHIRLVICREPPREAEQQHEEKDEGQELERDEQREFAEISLTATALVGQLKDKINAAVGKSLGLEDPEELEQLPRLALMTGRTTWPDAATLRAIISRVGGTAALRYGTLEVVLQAIDLRDPDKVSPEEQAELERLRTLHELAVLQEKRTKRTRKPKDTRARYTSSPDTTDS